MTTPAFLTDPPRFLFFTGKGGVGKTSLACATGVKLAGEGRRVLLVSTDPASNVGQVFGVTHRQHDHRRSPTCRGLSALEIDPQQAADAYREQIIDPVRGLLPDAEIDAMTEQLSGACTTEIASFNEFTALLADPARPPATTTSCSTPPPPVTRSGCCSCPASGPTYLDDGKGDVSCLGPVAGLDRRRHDYAGAVDALTDPTRTRLVLVTPPAALGTRRGRPHLQRAARARDAATPTSSSTVCCRTTRPATRSPPRSPPASTRALDALPADLRRLPRTTVPLHAVQHHRRRRPARRCSTRRWCPTSRPTPHHRRAMPDGFTGLRALVDDIEADGPALVMCMGKGGVGKTTVAAAIALELARRGHDGPADHHRPSGPPDRDPRRPRSST